MFGNAAAIGYWRDTRLCCPPIGIAHNDSSRSASRRSSRLCTHQVARTAGVIGSACSLDRNTKYIYIYICSSKGQTGDHILPVRKYKIWPLVMTTAGKSSDPLPPKKNCLGLPRAPEGTYHVSNVSGRASCAGGAWRLPKSVRTKRAVGKSTKFSQTYVYMCTCIARPRWLG